MLFITALVFSMVTKKSFTTGNSVQEKTSTSLVAIAKQLKTSTINVNTEEMVDNPQDKADLIELIQDTGSEENVAAIPEYMELWYNDKPATTELISRVEQSSTDVLTGEEEEEEEMFY